MEHAIDKGADLLPEATVVSAVLVDDDAAFRRGLRMLLVAQGVAVLGEASNGRDGVRLTSELRPDVVVLDTDMPILDGIGATRMIAGFPEPPAIVVLAGLDESPAALDAILAGARGCLLRDADYDQVASVVKAAANGASTLTPSIAGRLVTRMRELETERRKHSSERDRAALSTLECSILKLLAAGQGNTGIGRELYLSPSTVKQHVASVIDKLGVQNRVQAAVEAVRIGLA